MAEEQKLTEKKKVKLLDFYNKKNDEQWIAQ